MNDFSLNIDFTPMFDGTLSVGVVKSLASDSVFGILTVDGFGSVSIRPFEKTDDGSLKTRKGYPTCASQLRGAWKQCSVDESMDLLQLAIDNGALVDGDIVEGFDDYFVPEW